MKTVSFKCDTCGKETEPKPDQPSLERMPQMIGWYAIYARLGETAATMGVTIMDGAHACSIECATKLLVKGMTRTRTITLD